MRTFILSLMAIACLAQTPADWQGWLNNGVQAFKGARYADAVAAFQKAVELNPSSIEARLYLGTANMAQYIPGAQSPENLAIADRAEAQFRHALALQPDNAVALTSIASLQLNQRKFDEARESYLRMISAGANRKEAHYSLGFIAWSQWYPAYRVAREKLGMRPEAPGPIPDAGVRTELRNRWLPVVEDGIYNLSRALEIDPRYEDAMAYMNLLIRERADLRETPAEYRSDVAAADEWVRKVLETKREKAQQRAAGPSGGFVTPPPPPPPPPPSQQPLAAHIRIANEAAQQNLLSQTSPVYPPLAKEAGIQGTVRLGVIIGKEGRVTNLTVQSGHPLLIPAAMEAVKQWVYRPTLLNGNPVEVASGIDVTFALSR